MNNIYIVEKTILGENILIARKCAGLNHIKLVQISGVTRPVISGLENAAINPTFDTLLKLSLVLNINLDMLLFSEERYGKLKFLLKSEFERSKMNGYEIYFPEKNWKELLKLSINKEKRNFSKIIRQCQSIIDFNYPDLDELTKRKMTFCSVKGFLFQQDGFKNGIEFGIWLAKNLLD